MSAITFKNPLDHLSDNIYKSLPVSLKQAEEDIKTDNYTMAITPIATVFGWLASSKAFAARHTLAHNFIKERLQIIARHKNPLPSVEVIEKATHKTAIFFGIAIIVAAIAFSILCLTGFLGAYYDKRNNQEIVQLGENLSEHMKLESYWIELSTFKNYFTEQEKKFPTDSDDQLKCRVYKVFYQEAVRMKKMHYQLQRPECFFMFSQDGHNFLSSLERPHHIRENFTKDQLKTDEAIKKALFPNDVSIE